MKNNNIQKMDNVDNKEMASEIEDFSKIDFGESEEIIVIKDSDDTSEIMLNNSDAQKNKAFESRMNRKIKKDPILLQLLDKINPIDFDLICYGQPVAELREKLNSTYNVEEKEDIKAKLSKFKPNNRRKYVILIEELNRISEEIQIDLGINNTFPYYYNGSYWKEMPKDLIDCFLAIVAEKSGIKHEDAFHFNEIEKLFNQFVSACKIPTPEYDIETVKINLLNGTFVIRGDYQGLEKPSSEDMIKYQLPFEYNPTATAPMFHKFLDEVIPEADKQTMLAEYLGYIFVKKLKLEKCLILIGSGANGKSIVHSIVGALLGKENISSTSLSKLCEPNGYYRIKLGNVLLNYSSELGAQDCAPDTVKKLISTEPIDARSPHFAPIEIENYCRFMFNANEKPKETEQTHAYYRRFYFIRFGITIPLEKQDPDLAQRIIDNELSGIFNWVLEGLKTILKQRRFSFSPSAEEESNNFRIERNTVIVFLSECNYKVSATKIIPLNTIYVDYLEFCKNAGLKYPVSRPEFSKRLREEGFKVKPKCTNNATWVYCEIATGNEETLKIVEDCFNISNKN